MKIYVDLDHVDITEYTQVESGEYNTNKINFIFTPEYKDLVKVAIFGCKLDTDEPKFYKIYLSDDSCYLPSEVTTTSDVISIGVYAFNVDNGELKLRYSPTPVKTIVYEGSFREEAENSSSPTPTEIEQIMSRIISLEEITSDLNTRVEALENKACDLDTLKSDVAELKDDVENISGRVDTIESDIDDLEGDIANTYSKTEVDTLLGNKVDTTTFNSSQAAQDEKIAKAELILSQLPKVTGEGTNISLSPTIEYDLEVESLLGDTIQEGTPTPDTPVDIQVVTGEQEVNILGKNLIDFSKFTLTGTSRGTISTTSSSVTINMTGQFMAYVTSIPISNKTYKLSVSSISGSTAARIEIRLYKNGTQVGSTSTTTSNATINNTSGNYDEIRISLSNATTTTTDITFNELMLEVGTNVTTYSPYTSTSYTISLGNIELAKIGMAKDYIYKSGDKWYKYGAIVKVVLNGSENWELQSINSYGIANFRIILSDYNSSLTNLALSDNFSTQDTLIGNTQTEGFQLNTQKYLYIRIKSSTASTVSEFKTWLSTHNTIVYYALSTPSTTELTNETLLSNLEYIRTHSMSYSGTTNISTSGNLPIIITASALKQLS